MTKLPVRRHLHIESGRGGIGLSAVLIIGVILTVRAAMSDNRRSVSLLILETALAGLPAVLLTVSAIALR